jgi:hypothetical protein
MATGTWTAAEAEDRVRAICALLDRWHWDPTPNQAAVLLAALPGWTISPAKSMRAALDRAWHEGGRP